MIGRRIQRARKALGLSLRDLAAQVDVSHAAIKKYEDNIATPSSDMLLKLSEALHVRTEYFFRPEQSNLAKIEYRNHADIPARQKTELNAKLLEQIERRVELEKLFPSPPFTDFSFEKLTIKIKHYDEIESIADNIRNEWDLGLNPISDLIDSFEEHGIKVFEVNNQHYPKFEGLSADVGKIPVIVVGDQWPGDRQRFTLAHELGHIILSGCISKNLEEEQCCNRFAGAFLLPKKALINILGEHRNYIEPRELSLLKQEFGISMTAILHRAEDVGIISSFLYKQLRLEFDEKGWSKREPGEQYPQEKTFIFEQMIFRALAEEYIGESKAAELMNMSLETFRRKRAMEYQYENNNQ